MPSHWPEPKSVSAVGMSCTIDRPCVYQLTIPVTTDAEPSVAMKALTPNRVTTKPLTSPTKAPTATPTASPATSGQCPCENAAALSTEERPATAPTEKSNWPQISGTMVPSASTARTAWLLPMLRKSSTLRNTDEVRLHTAKNSTTRPSRMSSAQRSTSR